jgi:TolB-like protein
MWYPACSTPDGIVRAINESTILVLILSTSAVASAHVGKELERASSKRHPIIALRTDTAPLTPAFEYFLSESHWIDGAGGSDAAIVSLVGAVRQHLLPGGTTTPTPSLATSAIKHPAATPRRTWVIAGAVIVLALAGAYFFASKVWLHGHSVSAVRVAAGPSEVISDKSIAVLPFTDMSEKHDQEYFGDGMAEQILDLLAKIPGLTVIGRTSSFQFKGKNEDLRTIGTKLNAAYVLEGSVRKAGDQVRITTQLINTRTGAHEWSETYDRQIGDVLKLQDAIAAAVARELQLTVASEYLNSRSTVRNTEAYELYLRGRHAFDRFDQEGFDDAATLFQQALNRDPTSADVAAELAWTYDYQGEFGFVGPAVAFEQARRAAVTALKLDPKSAKAHFVLGDIHIVYDWDWAAAEQEYQQVATLAWNPMVPNGINIQGARRSVGRRVS